MDQSEKAAFCETVIGMASVFGRAVDEALLAGWWMAMSKKWGLQEFRDAAEHLIAEAKFMPVPADFNALRNEHKPKPAEAWQEALKRCREWRKPRDSSDLIDRAVAGVCGYRGIAMADIETALPHIERRFKEAYLELEAAEETRQALPHLAPAPAINRRDGGFTAVGVPAALTRRQE